MFFKTWATGSLVLVCLAVLSGCAPSAQYGAPATGDAAASQAASGSAAPLNQSEVASAPAAKVWYSPDSGFTECFESHGPAAKIESLNNGANQPHTRDFTDGSGELMKVEVIVDDVDTQHVWTYFRNRSQCEAEEIHANQNLADKYR